MNILLFGVIFSTVFALFNIYIIKRFVNTLHIKNVYKNYFKLFLLMNYLGIIGFIYIRFNPDVPNLLFFLFTLPLGVVFLTFCTAVIYDIKHFILKKVPISQNRRGFLKKGLDYGALTAVFAISGRAIYEARTIELEKVDIKIKNLKKSYTIVQLSDVHIGGIIDKDFIKNMVDRVNALNADLVVITGDLVDIGLKYAMPALNELTRLKSKYGTHFVVGNHEYLHGVEEIIKTVNSLGIKTLENENVYIGEKSEGFNLAGVYDYYGYRTGHYQPNLNKALDDLDKNSPTLLLTHQPVFIEEVKDNIDLVLSGHTHGGQLYPFRVLVKAVQPYLG